MSGVFAHGSLRLYLLQLLSERPMHGYEIIQAISERFGGTYSPSAGTIYPRLAKLETEGLVQREVEGRRATYSITESGRDELANRKDDIDDIETTISDQVRQLADGVRADVQHAMRTLKADLAAAKEELRAETKRSKAKSESGWWSGDPFGGHSNEERIPNPAAQPSWPDHEEHDTAGAWESTGGKSTGSQSTRAESSDAGSSQGADGFDGRRAEGGSDARASQNSEQSTLEHIAMREVELALAEFRSDVRGILRSQRRKGITPAVAGQIVATLHNAHREIRLLAESEHDPNV
ncbi:PadR family transcriptional regulator [Humidisolicoccus flavus]|uniref:PadR family transcriptional regulator n=1 Tax=Humidisolicoccus flavus TaxID=3111414 RepID=UPI00324AF176